MRKNEAKAKGPFASSLQPLFHGKSISEVFVMNISFQFHIETTNNIIITLSGIVAHFMG